MNVITNSMRKISKPTELCEDVFSLCISKVKDNGLKTLLGDAIIHIRATSADFDNRVTKGQLHELTRLYCGDGGLSVNDLQKVYTYRMVPDTSPGRSIYDRLLLSAELGVCPMCGHRDVTELDHYLPKSQYPLLSTNPVNLVPCCSDCNGLKDNSYPKNDYEEFIHPYYDDIEGDRWLQAKIKKTSPCSFLFFVDAPEHWPELLKMRLKYHFDELELGKLYAAQAGKEKARIRGALERRLNRGVHFVREYLEEEYETSKEFNANSWQTVFYEIALQNDWFCNGGFM